VRLDRYLSEERLVPSRNKAAELIKSGMVCVNEKMVQKPSFEIVHGVDDVVVLAEKQYVSRAAHKLKDFLDHLGIDLHNDAVLDIGSSTGGFVQVALEYGAQTVTAVDIGSDQLHASLRGDNRIDLFEQTDIREFQSTKRFDLVTCDISFISVGMILEQIDRLAKERIIILFKPQFEVGKAVKRDRRGVVQDEHAVKKSMEDFLIACAQRGWHLIDERDSSVAGKEGNVERLYYFQK
jgi:23S rRNA (cytidine1920-2'-O)/16S rRNA (cytidine1409-2'-O)-methyltransferase